MKFLRALRQVMLLAVPMQLLCTPGQSLEFRVNGVPMSVDRIVVVGIVEQLASDLIVGWRRSRSASSIIRRDAPGLIVLGRQQGSLHHSVQLRALEASKRVEITSTVTSLAVRPRRVPPVPLLPARGLHVDSVVESPGESRAITFIGTSALRMDELAGAVLSTARELGWTLAPRSVESARGATQILWVRGSQSIALQLQSQGAGARFVLAQQLGAAAEAG